MSHGGVDKRTREATSTPIRVLHTLPDFELGGGQQVLLRHIQSMDPDCFDHHVASFFPADALLEEFRNAGAKVHCLGPWRWRSAPRILRQVVRIVRRNRIDVIHTNGTFVDKLHGQLASLFCGVPHLTTVHGMRARSGRMSVRPRWLLIRLQRGLGTLGSRILDRWTLRHAVAVSDAVAENWQSYFRAIRLEPARVHVVYSGIPLRIFQRALESDAGSRIRAELGVDERTPLLITVSRLQPMKGLRRLIPVVKAVRARWPSALCVVAGEGPDRTALEATIREAGLQDVIVLLGLRKDVAELLTAADVFVFPSDREGFGLVVIEALAAGTPVVTARLPSLRHLPSTEGFVRTVEPGDIPAYIREVLSLLEDREGCRRSGEKGRDYVSRYWDVTRSAGQYEALYQQLTQNS